LGPAVIEAQDGSFRRKATLESKDTRDSLIEIFNNHKTVIGKSEDDFDTALENAEFPGAIATMIQDTAAFKGFENYCNRITDELE
jgi:hypothetical protein